MSLKIRFRFDGRCRLHPRYNPEKDGRPEHKDCSGCESLRVMHLYVSIAQKKARAGEGLIVSNPETMPSSDITNTGVQTANPETEQHEQYREDKTARLPD